MADMPTAKQLLHLMFGAARDGTSNVELRYFIVGLHRLLDRQGRAPQR